MFWAARRNLLRSIRAGRRPLLLYLALLSSAAGAVASCVGNEGRQSSAGGLLPPAQDNLGLSSIPRPARKPAPPPSAEPAPSDEEETTAMASPNPSRLVPATPSSKPSGSEAIPTSLGPSGSPPLQTSELIGLDQSAATRLFGPATERSDRPPATVWRYKNAACELDLFFYLDLRSGQMRTLHYAVTAGGDDTATRQDCLKSLLAQRNN
jgi:hypothetical protein